MKSTIIANFARENDLECNIKMLGQTEAGEFFLPVIDHDSNPLTAKYALPNFMPSDMNSKGILFLDELSEAEDRIRVGAYQLINDKRLGEHFLPDGWWVLGAGNTAEDGAMAAELPPALADRFTHIVVKADPKGWIDWAMANDVHPAVIGYIKAKPEALDGSTNPLLKDNMIVPTGRSWKKVSDLLKLGHANSRISPLISGRLGIATSTDFVYVISDLEEMPSIAALLTMKKKKEIEAVLPTRLTSLYSLAYSLVAYCTRVEEFNSSITVLEIISKSRSEKSGSEIKNLGMALLLEKVTKLGMADQMLENPELNNYLDSNEFLRSMD